ncbi:MAG: peptidase T [Peptoniphilaceae bacterium]|nr:peptidase T [Peptoniphilaceae bacterium]MDY6086244.1 peptidase T [Peptoniphilaceae bacterium]
MERPIDRLKRYASVDTQSNPDRDTCPSSEGQWTLAHLLEKEMAEIGLTEISLDENGYLFGTLPATTDEPVPTLGFLAHLDTSPDFPGDATTSRFVVVDGDEIELGHGRTLTAEFFPPLLDLKGEELLVTDGATLLGADDKAGIADILSAMEYLAQHPEIPHGKVRVGFTPDEEIGRGPHRFNIETFGADLAYTVDGSLLGELNYESFNACDAWVEITGESIHPGSAKNRMINAQQIAMELHGMLPAQMRPEYTENHEGFYMLSHIEGEVSRTSMEYIIRDHDRGKFEAMKEFLQNVVDFLNKKYGSRITLKIEDSYYNMADVITKHPKLMEIATTALEACGVTPDISPIRGGTDGSQLSYMGLPTANLFVGSHGAHGPYEVAVTRWMDKARDVIVEIVKRFAEE